MDRWKGRVALVTGASVGIGAAICKDLVKHGMKVIGCARNVDKICQLAQELPQGSLLPIKCDLSKRDDIKNLFKQIREKYGRIDVCINNAGMAKDGTLLNGKDEDWQAMLDVNVMALCICSREAIQLMREKDIDDGQIIQIGSIAGHSVVSFLSFYSGTKFMVRALTEGLRQELKQLKSHIRVASISPGAVRTEFSYRMLEDSAKVESLYETYGCMQPEDISSMLISILQTPPRVDVNDILVRPVESPI